MVTYLRVSGLTHLSRELHVECSSRGEGGHLGFSLDLPVLGIEASTPGLEAYLHLKFERGHAL